MFELRSYQQEAVDASISWVKKSIMPAIIEAATGAGKSVIIAFICKWFIENTGKKVLCLQPSRELTEQNAEKFRATGVQCSIFSASAGSKCLRNNVIYATPKSVNNSIQRFGDMFGLVIVDEAQLTTPTVREVIAHLQTKNPKLRILGLTGTPYTTNGGYIYQYDMDGSFVPDHQAREPFYNTLIYRITTRELLDMGFLTPIHSDITSDSYDTSSMKLNARGQFDNADVDRVFLGKGRLTAQIVADVVAHSTNRKGVMLFAQHVQHAKEIMQSLPPEQSRMIGGDVNMGKKDREKLVSDFKSRKFKYLVSVGTLTVGFDAPHVDLIAVLRLTESPGLFQQIIGRGLRLCDGKDDCVLLDYANNIGFHELHDDLFKPEIRAKAKAGEMQPIQVRCPACNFSNEFGARPNIDNLEIDEDGYFLDAARQRIAVGSDFMPAHYGRRCTGQVRSLLHPGVYERCENRWASKKCPSCDHDNDIAARYCESCKAEIIDPNEKLQRDFIRIKKDPYALSTDKVLEWEARASVSRSGKDLLICDYVTEYRKFTMYYSPESQHPAAKKAWVTLCQAVYRGHVAPNASVFVQHLAKGEPPKTITYKRIQNSALYEAINHNLPEDKAPNENT